jgi:hypothetical protein
MVRQRQITSSLMLLDIRKGTGRFKRHALGLNNFIGTIIARLGGGFGKRWEEHRIWPNRVGVRSRRCGDLAAGKVEL